MTIENSFFTLGIDDPNKLRLKSWSNKKKQSVEVPQVKDPELTKFLSKPLTKEEKATIKEIEKQVEDIDDWGEDLVDETDPKLAHYISTRPEAAEIRAMIKQWRPDMPDEVVDAMVVHIGAESGFNADILSKLGSSAYGYGQLTAASLKAGLDWYNKLYNKNVTDYTELTPQEQMDVVLHHYYDKNKAALDQMNMEQAVDFLASFGISPAITLNGSYTDPKTGKTYTNTSEGKFAYFKDNHPTSKDTSWEDYLNKRYSIAGYKRV